MAARRDVGYASRILRASASGAFIIPHVESKTIVGQRSGSNDARPLCLRLLAT
jgi:hypothetical protein